MEHFFSHRVLKNGDMLAKDWITAPAIDLELKQYVLLAYLQRVAHRFDELKLYPHLIELKAHLRAIDEWAQRKESLLASLPKELIGMDLSAAQLRYKPTNGPTHDVLQIIEQVMELAEPKLLTCLVAGQELRDQLRGYMDFNSVGLVPIRKEDGYILLHQPVETRVYEFHVGTLQYPGSTGDMRRSIRTRYVTSYTNSLKHCPEFIRIDLIKRHKHLANPLTLLVESSVEVPFVETFLPISRQWVYEYVVGKGPRP